VALETRVIDVVEEAFRVVDGSQEGGNEGDKNGDAKAPFDNGGQQPLGDVEFDLGD
jgi:hypothetical protein